MSMFNVNIYISKIRLLNELYFGLYFGIYVYVYMRVRVPYTNIYYIYMYI